jgi:hypothetical protein
MSRTYPKLIDSGNNLNFASIQFTNGIPIVSFGFVLYENGNLDNQTWDSGNNFVTFTPLSEFSYSYVIDAITNKYIQVTVECGAHTFIFNDGEYVDTNTNPLDLYDVVKGINTELGF